VSNAAEHAINERLDGLTARLDNLVTAVSNRADHSDELHHQVLRELEKVTSLIEKHQPALDRAAALLDPGAGARRFLGRGKAAGQ
jgi:ABC-type transporter Mla subunit MlaD